MLSSHASQPFQSQLSIHSTLQASKACVGLLRRVLAKRSLQSQGQPDLVACIYCGDNLDAAVRQISPGHASLEGRTRFSPSAKSFCTKSIALSRLSSMSSSVLPMACCSCCFSIGQVRPASLYSSCSSRSLTVIVLRKISTPCNCAD